MWSGHRCVLFKLVVRDLLKDHAVAAFMSIQAMNPTTALHHYRGPNCVTQLRLVFQPGVETIWPRSMTTSRSSIPRCLVGVRRAPAWTQATVSGRAED